MTSLTLSHLYIFLIGLAASGLICWGISRVRSKIEIDRIKSAYTLGSRALEEKLSRVESKVSELEYQLQNKKNQLDKKDAAIHNLIASAAAFKEKVRQIPDLRKSIEKRESQLDRQIRANTVLEKKLSQLSVLFEEEKKNNKEKQSLLLDAKDRFKTEFENLANSILEENSKKFTVQNKLNIDTLLLPLREQIGDFKKKVEDVYDKEAKDRMSLYHEIGRLKDLNQRIGKEATNLTTALKVQNKTQGTWGEMILEKVLEGSGLRKGHEYETQVVLNGVDGKRYQPDVIIRIPGGKDVIIDSKVSLTAYERFFSAPDKDQKTKAMKAHILSIRSHVRDLSVKSYDNLKTLNSLDFILMFIPVEGAFWSALEHDSKLFGDAFNKNIMVVCPSTLLVTLRTIHNIWKAEFQNRNSKIIAERAGRLYDKFVGFVDALDEVGKQLDKAKDAFNTANDRLIKGRGNLVNRAKVLKDLGVLSKKEFKNP